MSAGCQQTVFPLVRHPRTTLVLLSFPFHIIASVTCSISSVHHSPDRSPNLVLSLRVRFSHKDSTEIRTGGLGVLENGLLVVASVRGVHGGRWIFLEGNSTKGNEPNSKSRGADNVEKGLVNDVNSVGARKRAGRGRVPPSDRLGKRAKPKAGATLRLSFDIHS